MGDGKAKSVIAYLDNLIEKGKVTKGAVNPLKVTFAKVLQTVDGVAWTETEVRTIDIEDYMARFANLTMGKYTTESLTVYKSRVNRAVNWYIQFLDKPGWTPDVQRRIRTPKDDSTRSSSDSSKAITVASVDSDSELPQSMPSVANAPNRILYPFPLSDGQLIHVSLPVKLSKSDARRVSAFIESIAVDDVIDQGERQRG